MSTLSYQDGKAIEEMNCVRKVSPPNPDGVDQYVVHIDGHMIYNAVFEAIQETEFEIDFIYSPNDEESLIYLK